MLIFELASFILFRSDRFLLVFEVASLDFTDDLMVDVLENPIFMVGVYTNPFLKLALNDMLPVFIPGEPPLIVGDLLSPALIVGDLPNPILIVGDLASGERKSFFFVYYLPNVGKFCLFEP